MASLKKLYNEEIALKLKEELNLDNIMEVPRITKVTLNMGVGEAIADKKAGRNTNEGLIYSYIHTGSKLGILVEVNCETDFVAKREEFIDLAKNIAMQIASNPDIVVVSPDDISESAKEEVRRFESGKEDLQNKPEEIRNKIVEGRIEKSLKKQVLLDQEYIRDPNSTVNEYIKQVVGVLGENIRVARFTRFVLGETD